MIDIAAILAAHGDTQADLLPILHAVQEQFDHIPDQAIAPIAAALNLSQAEILGCLSFYPDFRRTPPGRHVLRLCRAEACATCDAAPIAQHVQRRLRIGWHQTTDDGNITLLPVFCLGLCAIGPSAQWDDQPIGRLDIAQIDDLIDGALAARV